MVRKYEESDFESIRGWGKAWGADYDKDLFPPLGYIYPGVAAYFIYESPCKVCWLENMVSNPDVPQELKEQALQQVVTEVLKEVHRLGYKVAYATTDNKAVINRAVAHKASAKEGQTLLTLAFK